MALIPFGKPFPAIDSVSLRDGVSAGLVNGFINELGDYEKIPGHTLFGTHSDAKAIDGLWETLDGTVLVLTNGKIVRLNSDGTFTALTGPALPSGVPYWAEDGRHVYLAISGSDLVRVDVTNLTYATMNAYSPWQPTHICRAKGFLLTNGRPRVLASSAFEIAQVFDDASSLDAVVKLDDKPGWLIATGRRTATPGNLGRIYLSKDNGLTWAKVHSISSNSFILALEYMGGGVVLAGTGITTGRILRSTDYGETWTDLGQQGSSTVINFIRKLTSTVAIAGTGSGTSLGKVYRSTNTGSSWSALGTDFGKQVTEGEPITSSGATVVIGTISNGDAIVLWRSTDTGASFSSIQTLSGAGYIPAIQRLSDTIAILSNGSTSTTNQKVWRSTDAGATWADIGVIPDFPGDALPYAFCVTTDGSLLLATAGNNVGTGGAQIWKSLDNGLTWSLVAELLTDKTAAIQQRGLKETHVAGTVIATGRIDLGNNGVNTAAKWQTGIGKSALPGDVYFSEDIATAYGVVDSWEFFNAEQVPDAVNGVFEHRGLVYAAGPRSVEINFNQADPNTPWAFSDPALPFGLLAPDSWVSWDQLDTIMYLTHTDNVIQVVKLRDRTQKQISQEYAEILNDRTLITSPSTAKAWAVALRGMPHYVLSFPGDNLTICYNITADHWWRWGYWTGTAYQGALVNSYCYWKAQNKHLVGDRRNNGRIYTLGGLTDNGDAIRFELTSGNITRETDRLKLASSVIHKTKRGQVSDTSEARFRTRTRDDGGNWSRYRDVSLGFARESDFFASEYQLGSYRARQYQIVHDDTKSDFIYSHGDEQYVVGRY